MQIKLSIHPSAKGKIPTENLYLLGNGWQNVELTWEQAFELITVDGYATSAELSNDNRSEANFVSRQLCMIDIDNGMRIEQLLNDPFYNEFGAGFYTTPSHTNDHHRFRICFVLEQPEHDCERMKAIIRGLMKVYGDADPACKDASRLYFGTVNCVIKELRDKVLTKDAIDVLAEQGKEVVQYMTEPREYPKHTSEQIIEIAEKLKSLYPDLEYEQWIRVTWGFCNELGKQEGIQLMRYFYPEEKSREYEKLVKSNSTTGKKVTLGTIIKMIKDKQGVIDYITHQKRLFEYNEKFNQSKYKVNN